jgi:hypothetical protein
MANGDMLEAQVGQVTLGNLEVAVEGESFNSQSNLEIRDIAVRTDAVGQEGQSGITATGGALNAESIAVEATRDATSITFDVATEFESVRLQDPSGTTVNLGSVSAGTPGMTVAGQGGEVQIRGPVQIGIDSIESQLPSDQGDLNLTARSFRFDTEDFDISGGESLSLALSGVLDITDLQVEKGGANPLTVTSDGGHIDLDALKVDPLGARAAMDAKLKTKLTNLRLSLGAGDEAQEVTVADTEVVLERLKVSNFEPLSDRKSVV